MCWRAVGSGCRSEVTRVAPSEAAVCFFTRFRVLGDKGENHIFSQDESIFQKQECIRIASTWLIDKS